MGGGARVPGAGMAAFAHRDRTKQPKYQGPGFLNLTEEEFEAEMREAGASEHMIQNELATFRILKKEHDAISVNAAERRKRNKDRDLEDDSLSPYLEAEARRKSTKEAEEWPEAGEDEETESDQIGPQAQ